MQERYLLVCQDRGLFIGRDAHLGYFSKMDALSIYATTFPSAEEAQEYSKILDAGHERGTFNYTVLPIETKKPHVSVVDIIKAGYGDITGNMLTYLPPASDSVN